MPGGVHLSGARVDPQSLGPFPCYQRRLAIGRAGTEGYQRLRDPAGNELILLRRVRPLVEGDTALAPLARVRPRLLPWQNFGEAMWTIAIGREALVVLPPMPSRAVVAIEPHPRPTVLRPRTADLGQTPTLARGPHQANVNRPSDSSPNASPRAFWASECSRRCVGGAGVTTPDALSAVTVASKPNRCMNASAPLRCKRRSSRARSVALISASSCARASANVVVVVAMGDSVPVCVTIRPHPHHRPAWRAQRRPQCGRVRLPHDTSHT
jgi:hypothetical protein